MKNLNKLIPQLRDWLSGDESLLEKLQSSLYDHLFLYVSDLNSTPPPNRDVAVTVKMRESLGLGDVDLSGEEQAHLLAIIAGQIRRVLIDLNTKYNVAESPEYELGSMQVMPHDKTSVIDFLTLDNYIQELSRLDERKATLIEWAYFGGLNYDEMALILSVPIASIDREIRFARAWLCKEIESRK